MRNFIKDVNSKKKNLNLSYKEIWEQHKRIQWQSSKYGVEIYEYLKSQGLSNMPIGSSGVNINVDDPADNHAPLVGYSDELKLYGGALIHDEINLDMYKFTTFIENPLKPYRSDLYYYFNLTSHSNNIRIGFITDDLHNDGIYVNNTSILKPTFYYNSSTGDCVMGTSIIRTDLPHRSTLFIRIDEDLNIYIGRTDTNYKLVGNIMDYSNLVNNINLSIRLCYEIETNASPLYKIELLSNGYKEFSQINTQGITWPNWGITSLSNRLLNTSLNSTSQYLSFIISPILDIAWGTIASFTLKCSSSNIDELYIGTTSDVIFSSSSSLSSIGLSTNGIYYDSLNNIFMDGFINNGMPDTFPFPSPNTTNGQIYFKIDINRNIYAGVGPNSNALIGTFPSSIDPVKFYIIAKSNSNKIGTFEMVDVLETNPANQTIPLDPLDNQLPLTGYTIQTNTLQNNTNSHVITNMTLNNYNVYISNGVHYYGTDVFWELSITPSGNNNIKIGLYTDGSIPDGATVSPSQILPQIYYDYNSGKCYVNTIVLKTLPDKLTNIVIRIDEDLNVYIGRTLTNYSLLLNLTDYPTITYNITKSFRLGYSIYANTNTFTLNTLNSGYKVNSQISTRGITWPNVGIKDIELYNLKQISLTNGEYKLYMIDTIFGATWGGDYAFTLQSLNGSSLFNTSILITTTLPSTLSNINIAAIYNSSTSFEYHQWNSLFYNNAVLIGQPTFFPYPNLNDNDGQIYFRISNRDIYSGYSASTQSLVATVTRSGPIYIGILFYNETSSGYNWSIAPTIKFIPNNYTSPQPITNVLNTLTNQLPLVGFSNGPSLNGSTSILTSTWASNVWRTNVIDLNIPYRKGFYYYLSFKPLYQTKIGIIVDGSIPSGSTNSAITPQYYYDSSTGDCVAGTNVVYIIPQNLDTIFLYIDEDLNLYIGRTDTNYDLLANLGGLNYLSLLNNNQFYARLCISQFNTNVGQQPTSTSIIKSGVKEFSNILTDGMTWPNLGIFTTSRFLSTTLTTTAEQFTRRSISFIQSATWGNLYSFTLQCNSSLISNVYIVIGTSVVSGTYSSLGLALGSTYICYDALNNIYFNEIESLGQPTTYPFPDINAANGTIHFSIDSLKNIYIGKGTLTKQLVTSTTLTGNINVAIIVNSSSVNSGTWSVIRNGINDPPLEPIPLNPLYNQAPLSGYTSSGVNLVNGNTIHNITGMISGRYYTFIQAPTFNYGTDVFYYIELTPSNNVKIGFYTDGTIASGNTLDSLSSNPPQFYYNSLNGQCYAGTSLITTIEAHISPIFIRLDSAFNFYVGRTETNYQLICNVFSYPLLTNSVGLSFRLGYEIKA